ncbi:MAG: F0F1 ATP synthase subunit B [bacterium]|nr:F0F1 ATP synthase subunit B [bacterium]
MLRLDINLLFVVIDLLILVFILKKFLIGPVHAIIEQRQKEVEQGFAEADTAKQQAEALKQKYTASLDGVEAEREALSAKARQEAQAEYEHIVEDAQNKAGKLVSSAKEEAKAQKERILREANSQITDLVVEATGKVMGVESKAANTALYDQFLRKAGEKSEAGSH